MATPLFKNNPQAAEYLKQRWIDQRWRTAYVIDDRLTKREARARAFAALRQRMGR